MTSSIDSAFVEAHPKSAALAREAAGTFPSGITHDTRHFQPFPIYIDRAAGPRKWDVDGHTIIDYVMGHGALLFGHAHPLLVEAVSRQVDRGTHYGGSSDAEIRWARAVQHLVPSAEKVRFTSSGTEATMLAVRLARASTGRNKLLKLREHFHGWNDSLIAGSSNSSGLISSNGLPAGVAEGVTIVDQHDLTAIAAELDSGHYAAAICEPTGYHWGTTPLDPEVLALLRDRTSAAGTILIFDEVVTGFRASPGGVQAAEGIVPDLTTLAKILAGGMPGGAVVGRADLLDQIAYRPDGSSAPDRIAHPGTFNANPLSAAAGIAALNAVADGEPNRIANERALQLTKGLNHAIRQAEVPGAAYGHASMVHIILGEEVDPPDDDFTWHWGEGGPQATVPETRAAILWPFRQSLMNHGVDLMGMGAHVSCVHTEADIDQTLDAFAAALADLRRHNVL